MAGPTRVTMEVGADGVALITICSPQADLHPIIIHGLKEKYAEAFARDDVKAIVLTGAAGNFCGGFDIKLFREVHETGDLSLIPDVSVELVSNMMEDGKKPSVAAIQGLAAGGGLELTMGCHARIATLEAQLGLPELLLGVIPGFGGTQRLARLVGLPKAIEMMLQSKFIMAKEGKECGLIDEVCSPDELIKMSRVWALEIANHRKPRIRSLGKTDRLGSLSDVRAVLSIERHQANKVAANMPHHRACLDVIEEGVLCGGRAGVLKEAKVFKELVVSTTSRALVHLFWANHSTTKVPGVTDTKHKPRRIRKVAVIGGGLMGSGIATALLVGNIFVVLKELNLESLQAGLKTIEGNLEGLVKRGSLTKDQMSKAISFLKGAVDYSDFKDVDMVIEAVIGKDPLRKQSIFADIEKICPPDCVLATSTSTIDLNVIGEKTNSQDRIIGAHFFSPAHTTPLLEIARTERTPPQAILDLITVGKILKKVSVVVGNCTGFAVNRTFSPYTQGAQLLVSLGIDPFRIDRVISNFGMPMGPFQLLDVVGYGVPFTAKDIYAVASGKWTCNSSLDDWMAQNFRRGKSYGRGYYLYEKGRKPKPDLSVQHVIDDYRRQAKTMPGGKPVTLSDQDILEMIFFPVVNEAYRVMDENVVTRVLILTLPLSLGWAFPSTGVASSSGLIRSEHLIYIQSLASGLKPTAISSNHHHLWRERKAANHCTANTGDTGAASLPYHVIFDILSWTRLKSVCRFQCVSKGLRDLISSHFFVAAHRSHHGPLLVDTGSFEKEEPAGGRDLRLMDMDGNVVRVIKGAGGYGMTCNTSLDNLICVNGASCDGVSVVNPATGEVLLTCPQVDVVEHDAFPYVATRYYTVFGFGHAIPSGEYKLMRVEADNSCEILTLGDSRGWRIAELPPLFPCPDKGSPVGVDGVMYFMLRGDSDDLLCFDLESEKWKPDVLKGPRYSDYAEYHMGRFRTARPIRITELNGSLCLVETVLGGTFPYMIDNTYAYRGEPNCRFNNIWILDNSDKRSWSKPYMIPNGPAAFRYMPLWMRDDGKMILQCSFDLESLVLQIYDPCTGTFTDIVGQPGNLSGRIGVCSFRFRN